MTIFLEKSSNNNLNSKGFYDYLFFDGLQKKGSFEGKIIKSNDVKVQEQKMSLVDKKEDEDVKS